MFDTPRFQSHILNFTSQKDDQKFIQTYFDPPKYQIEIDEPKPTQVEIEMAQNYLKKLGII